MKSFGSIKLKTIVAAGAFTAASLASLSAQAQGVTADQLGLSQAQVQALLVGQQPPKSAPGISFGSPVAFGAGWGSAGIGIGGATQPGSGGNHYDGSMGVIFGIGNPDKYVGLEAGANIISLRDSGPGDSFAHDGNMQFKLHTNLPGNTAFAVGVENVVRWGRPKTGGTRSSVYAVGTKIVDLNPGSASNKLPLAINVGVGDNRFTDSGKGGADVFGSLALLPIQSVSIITDWTGATLNMGASWAPLRNWPLTITLGAVDLTTRKGQHPEFAGGIGYGIFF